MLFRSEHAEEFLRHSGRRAQDLLEELDAWLAERADAGTGPTVSLGLAAFQIVERMPASTDSPSTEDGVAPSASRDQNPSH